ncbi:pyridoxamine 5'-phosphate oxidase family protein [Amnibacterium flavum]|uniref:General stress protein n=1 Tax=Amnibacterium flavum TaxID=2173173 RepID=A0A2V1HVU2_9MICO|nr:pyridoxamine 5'-phosphate oxidase family protein [Amnibacterium flavum]PVZ94507.1 general stress protein [Amnibacterium flavum]
MTTATKDELETIGKIVKAARIGLLTTISEDGRLLSRPLATVEAEFDGDVWFFTADPSHKTEQLQLNNQVNVAYESGKGYLSIAGTAEIVHDRSKIDELWTPAAEAWFEQGKDDPNIALIKVHAESAEYWASLDPKPVVLLKYAKAIVTHDRPDIGENASVDL